MAKSVSSKENNKISFGKRKHGKAKKSYNKNDKTEKNYRGQGR